MTATALLPLPTQLLAAVIAGLPSTGITLEVRVTCEADAYTWVEALQLTDVKHEGQPYPLNAVEPEFWIGVIEARGAFGRIAIRWHEMPYTAEHEARWVAADGPKRHPRVPAPAEEPRCPDPECGEPLAEIASGAVGHCGRTCTPAEPQAVER